MTVAHACPLTATGRRRGRRRESSWVKPTTRRTTGTPTTCCRLDPDTPQCREPLYRIWSRGGPGTLEPSLLRRVTRWPDSARPCARVAAIVISAAAVACLVVAQHAKSGPFGLLSRPTQLFVSTWKALTPDGVMGADLHIRSSHRSVRTSTRAQAHKEDDKLDLFFGIHHFPGSAAGLAKARRTNGLQQRAARTTLLDSLPGHMDPTLYLQQLEQKSVLKQNAYMKSWAHKNLVAARQQQLFQARRPSRRRLPLRHGTVLAAGGRAEAGVAGAGDCGQRENVHPSVVEHCSTSRGERPGGWLARCSGAARCSRPWHGLQLASAVQRAVCGRSSEERRGGCDC